jgi:hypothetical protein
MFLSSLFFDVGRHEIFADPARVTIIYGSTLRFFSQPEQLITYGTVLHLYWAVHLNLYYTTWV